MKVAVTGAAGFIGTWLCRELAAAGHEPLGADLRPGQYARTQIDLLGRQNALQWLEKCQPDAVVHLAAQVGRVFGEEDLSRTVRWNAELTALVADACGSLGVRMVYVSTSEIYGDQGGLACAEHSPWLLPHNLYGLSKRWGEEVCQLYAPDGLLILRPSMPYGPGCPPGLGRRAMDTMLWQAHHRMPITVHRGAERSWCWVGDTVRGMRMAMERSSGGVFNIGRDDDQRSMCEVAELACKLADAPTDLIVEVDAPPRQTLVKWLPMDRLRGLGWAPSVYLEDGMARVYRWVRQFDVDGNR